MKRLFLKALPLVLAILCAACTKRSEIPDSFDGTVYLENGTRIELIKVVPGTYTIGLPAESVFSAADVPRRDVAVEKEYWLGKYEITIEQWDAVMGGHEKYSGNGVLFVNWKNCAFAKATREKAAMFIDRLNTLYADRLPDGYRFDLPTEEQWEIACRAGTTTRYPWGDAVELEKAAMVAFPEIEKSGTVRTIIRFLLAYSRSRKFVLRSRLSLKVGRYPANGWGFHDMIGNVSELCQDSPAIPAPRMRTDMLQETTVLSSAAAIGRISCPSSRQAAGNGRRIPEDPVLPVKTRSSRSSDSVLRFFLFPQMSMNSFFRMYPVQQEM